MDNPGTGYVNVPASANILSIGWPKGVQGAAVACNCYIFLCLFLWTWESQALVDTLERIEC